MYIMNVNLYRFLAMEAAEKYEINNPHDKLFKDILNDKEEFCELINRFVNKGRGNQLLPENIEKANTSYITPIFKSKESDVLYKKVNEEKYYLVEHQSTIDDSIAFRMLNYCVNILNDITQKDKLKNKMCYSNFSH